MYIELFKKNIIKTLILSIIMILFISLVFTIEFESINDELYSNYLELPTYLKFLLFSVIPLFDNFNYLLEYILFYLIIIIAIYTIILAKNKVENYLLPIKPNNVKIYQFIALFSHILILLLVCFITILVCNIIKYNTFNLSIISSFIILFLLSINTFFLVRYNKNRLVKILLYILLVYSVSLFIINMFVDNNILFYLSIINLLYQPVDNLYSIICPIIITILIALLTYIGTVRK